MLDMKVRRMLCYGLICPLVAYAIAAWGQSIKTFTRQILTVKKERAVSYTAGLQQLESHRDSFRQLKIMTVFSL
jgi:hypothetical protein